VFTARYALSPYIKQIRFVFKGLKATKLFYQILQFGINKKIKFSQLLFQTPALQRSNITSRHFPSEGGASKAWE
jgi:hypothetical protein